MISYYLFMGLLCLTLTLWAIIAIRDDEKRRPEPGNTAHPADVSPKDSGATSTAEAHPLREPEKK